jgi:hypothetical protein
MKKKILFILAIVLSGAFFYMKSSRESEVELLRKKHSEFLKNHPFKNVEKLSKKERFAMGSPPNNYLERMWVLQANPALGRPTPEKLSTLYEELKADNSSERVPGDGADNSWVERGPNNVGGRTRTVFFDPNDPTNETVFAGGVSGGLWKNTNISNANSIWTRIEDLDNFSISCYTIDPNNSNIWYLGTGESYTSGDAIGNGVYRTTNGGVNWTRVLSSSGATDTSNAQYTVPGIYYVNDIIVRDKDGNSATADDSEVFVGVASSFYRDGGNSPSTFLGVRAFGLYKSTNNGSDWTWMSPDLPEIPEQDTNTYGALYAPNDFELGADNVLWMSSTRSVFGNGGGTILKSVDGTTFTVEHTIADGARTELATSKVNAGTIFGLASVSGGNPILVKTTDGFATEGINVNLPIDPDGSVTDADFTRGQSGYDLVIEVDPSNDAILYVGGINGHRSGVNDPGGNPVWETITYWSAGWSTTRPGSEVHADHHALEFKPSNTNQGVFGTDGGVSYTTDFSDAAEGNNAASAENRNNGLNITQFYTIGVAPTSAFPDEGDYFLAGAQDNGTQLIANASAGQNASTDVSGGDGAYSFFDQDGTEKYYITNYVYNQSITVYNYATGSQTSIANESDSNGDFINVEELDSQLNVLYSNYSSGENSIIRRYAGLPDGPITFTDMTDDLFDASPTAMKASPRTSELLVGTENGKLLKVSGTMPFLVWSDISNAGFLGSVSDIEFGETDNDIFVTFHNYGVQNVWYSNDGGTSWLAKEGDFPDIPVKAILQNPINLKEVIIGTDLGVWKTTDFSVDSPEWTQSYSGMNSVKVTDLDLRDDNMVFAATYGRGVFSGRFTAATASVEDVLSGNNAFTIYPTVSKGDFTLQAKSSLGLTKMSVFSISGKQVYTKEIDFTLNGKQQVSLKLNTGLYIVNIIDENNKKTSRKIVIE